MCGVGSAMENPTGIAIILSSFPKSRHGLLLGLTSTVATVANSLGLLLGGIVTEYYGWRVLFLGPFLPVGAALFLAICVLPGDPPIDPVERSRALRTFDWLGTAVFSAMMVSLLFGINQGGVASFADPIVVTALAVAAVLLPLLLRIEARAKHAILPPALLAAGPVALTLSYSVVRDSTYMVGL
jgi:MFS family permease